MPRPNPEGIGNTQSYNKNHDLVYSVSDAFSTNGLVRMNLYHTGKVRYAFSFTADGKLTVTSTNKMTVTDDN